MSESRWTEAGSDARRAPLAFPGTQEGLGMQAEDMESDWDEIRFVSQIARDGFVRTEALDGDWD